ncbi:MAG: alkaline phosphatase, partial [Pseudomonadota bacterium]
RARLTHATPASTYAESANRNWEDDTSFGNDGSGGCADIASQLIDWPEGDGFEIAMGGGRRHFMTDETFDPEYEGQTGMRADERDLVVAWTAKSDDHAVIYTGDDFAAAPFDSDIRVLGLFEPSHMQYEYDRSEDPGTEPSLAEMTKAAITRLSRNDNGYVLMVEGGRIDHAHHGVNAARALEDTDAFDQAVAAALEMTSAEDTLIIVTADHSHTMTMAGYPRRNNPILGKVVYETGAIARGDDGKPYTTLGYANGQSACRQLDDGATTCTRQDLSDVDTTEKNYQQQALVFMGSETHAGEDVAIFASGPGSDLVRGVMDQNEIFHVMGFASGLVAQTPPTE